MKLYHCFRQGGESLCEVQSAQPLYLLAPRLDIANQSPQGFAWIDSGAGASQLSLALLADHFAGDNKPSRISAALALCLHHSFKTRVVSNRPPHGFDLSSFAVRTEVSLLAEAHNEPLMLTIAEVLQREFSREQKCGACLLLKSFAHAIWPCYCMASVVHLALPGASWPPQISETFMMIFPATLNLYQNEYFK